MMNRKIITACLALTIALQIAVLAGEYLGAVYPLWTGEEIKLKAVPLDPRSLFMGNYARLRYDISSIELKGPENRRPARNGEFVYVKLKPGPEGLFVFDGATFERPGSGAFIRGRLQTPGWGQTGENYEVRYGIEAFFAPRNKALALEKGLAHGGVATIMVSSSGKATLKDVTSGEK